MCLNYKCIVIVTLHMKLPFNKVTLPLLPLHAVCMCTNLHAMLPPSSISKSAPKNPSYHVRAIIVTLQGVPVVAMETLYN